MVCFPKTNLPTMWLSTSIAWKRWICYRRQDQCNNYGDNELPIVNKMVPLISACCIESQRSSVIHNRSTLVMITILHNTICRYHRRQFQILLIWNNTRMIRSLSFVSMLLIYSSFVDVSCWQQRGPMYSVCYLI